MRIISTEAPRKRASRCGERLPNPWKARSYDRDWLSISGAELPGKAAAHLLLSQVTVAAFGLLMEQLETYHIIFSFLGYRVLLEED